MNAELNLEAKAKLWGLGTPRLSEVVALQGVAEYREVGNALVPWQIASTGEDYRHIRHDAGIVDLSGAGLIEIKGGEAEALLNQSLSRDISYMTPERSLMALIVTEQGSPVDVVTIFCQEGSFLVLTSIGCREVVGRLLEERVSGRAEIANAGMHWAVIGIEGPTSVDVLGQVLPDPVEGLPFQGTRQMKWLSHDVLLARTGVTGEFGFTLFIPWSGIKEIWSALAAIAHPVGLDALETTMIEVRQPILPIEVLEDDTVMSAGLNWLVDLDNDFVGKDSILAALEQGVPLRRLSVVSEAAMSHGDALFLDGEEVGQVVVARKSFELGSYAGIARVNSDFAVSGLELQLGSGAGSVVRSVSSPSCIPTSWQSLRP